MKIKKQIKEHFNSIKLPSADKLLPEVALEEKRHKSPKRLTLRLAIAVLCVGVIATSLIAVLSRSPKTSPMVDVSDILSQDEYGSSNPDSSNNASSDDGMQNVGNPNGSESVNYAPDYSEPDEQEPGQQEPDVQEPQDDPQVPDQQEPVPDVLTVYGNSSVSGEFAGDMHRPEGYHKNIGSVLAIMMSMNNDKSAKFNVLVHTYDAIDLKEYLLMFVEEVEILTVEIDGNFAGQAFCVRLTDAQIKTLTDVGLKCYYIGSGLGDYKDINWETEEGIKTYCEIWGDMYTFNFRGNLEYNPDVYPEKQ